MKSISVVSTFLTIYIAVCAAEISTAEDVAVENLRKLALANNEFAFSLHRRLVNGSSKNVFFSPLGISTAFGMLLYGARGDTAEKLKNVLGYKKAKLVKNVVHDTYHRYFNDVLKRGNSSDGYVLNSTNAVLFGKNLGMLEKYERNVEELYSVDIKNLDFQNLEGSKIVSIIDVWVSEKIGKIRTIKDVMGSDSLLSLMNALYFKGAWKTQFNPRRTSKGVFYNNGLESEAKNVSMMRVESTLHVVFSEDFRAWKLPYKGGNVSMLILLPRNRDGLQALEESLTPEKLDNIQKKMRPLRMLFSLPKFNLEFRNDLSEDLQALGASEIFSASADFSGISITRDVSMFRVFYNADIHVNEEGSLAAAVTNVSKEKRGLVPFAVNHPFLFAIMEKGSKSNMVLYLGRVNNL